MSPPAVLPAALPLTKTAPEWKPIFPVPASAPAPDFHHFKWGRPSGSWAYRNAEGALMFYVCRYDLPLGRKEFWPFSWCALSDGSKPPQWRKVSHPGPRPLFQLDQLAQSPQAKVLVVSGEKCATAAQELLRDWGWVVTTWANGDNSVEKTDWAPLSGRKLVVIWGDHDESGQQAAKKIAELTQGRLVKIPQDKPAKWDAADAIQQEGWQAEQLLQFIHFPPSPYPSIALKKEATLPESTHKEATHKESTHKEPAHKEATYKEATRNEPARREEQLPPPPYTALGQNKGSHYFITGRGGWMMSYTSNELNKRTMQDLANKKYWLQRFPNKREPGEVDWERAATHLINLSYRAGDFNENRVRGRGAWIDEGRFVLHMGNHLIVDGRKCGLKSFDTKYAYEKKDALGRIHSTAKPLSSKEAEKLLQIMTLLKWEKDPNAYLAAGWVVAAIICGALNWRPHVWLTGGAGVGKTFIIDSIIKPILEGMAIHRDGRTTTEAAIRQYLGSDALPVVIDEAESEGKHNKERIQNILGLMRPSSSDTASKGSKGSASGKAIIFDIRSTFLLSSINTQAEEQEANNTRTSILGLKKNDGPDRGAKWAALQALVKTLTEEWCAAFRARAIAMIPTIRANAARLKIELTPLYNSRVGDQLGTLFSCAASVYQDGLLSPGEIRYFLSMAEIIQGESATNDGDEHDCLEKILQYLVGMPSEIGLRKDVSIGELIAAAVGRDKLDPLAPVHEQEAVEFLKRYGIRHAGDKIWFSNKSTLIKKILSDTPWQSCYPRTLKRINGAESSGNPIRFSSTSVSVAVGIPLSAIFKYEEE